MKRLRDAGFPALACALLAACAHGRGAPAPKADEAMAMPMEAPAEGRARLYADCATDAAQAKAITRLGHYLRFTCTGAPAKAMYDAAEMYARLRGLEVVTGQRTTRHIASDRWDDQCWRDRDPTTGEAAYGCFTDEPMSADFVDGKDIPPSKARKM